MILKQGDPSWSHLPLGYGPATIGESGCLLTADAQVLLHYGFSTNPALLNGILKANGRWVSGDLLGDAAISLLPNFPGVQFVTKWDFTNRAADLSVLTNTQQDEYIIEIDFDHNPNDGIQTHFVRFVSYLNGVLVIDDPEYGTEDNFTTHYGTDLATTILKIVKYTGPVAAAVEPIPGPVAPVPPNATPTTAFVGTAEVLSPANVRTGPGTQYPINADHTPNGKLGVGTNFEYIAVVTGQDPYGDGRNQWVESEFHNYVWEGNLSLSAGKGGSPVEPVADPPAATPPDPPIAPTEPAAEPTVPGPEDIALEHIAWLKPVLNDQTRQFEGAPVFDLATKLPVATVPMDTKVPFISYRPLEGINYFRTQHMIDNNLNNGINGLDLTMAEQPGDETTPAQAETVTPEAAKADTKTSVKSDLTYVGPVWSRLFDFIEKHHK